MQEVDMSSLSGWFAKRQKNANSIAEPNDNFSNIIAAPREMSDKQKKFWIVFYVTIICGLYAGSFFIGGIGVFALLALLCVIGIIGLVHLESMWYNNLDVEDYNDSLRLSQIFYRKNFSNGHAHVGASRHGVPVAIQIVNGQKLTLDLEAEGDYAIGSLSLAGVIGGYSSPTTETGAIVHLRDSEGVYCLHILSSRTSYDDFMLKMEDAIKGNKYIMDIPYVAEAAEVGMDSISHGVFDFDYSSANVIAHIVDQMTKPETERESLFVVGPEFRDNEMIASEVWYNAGEVKQVLQPSSIIELVKSFKS